MRKRGPRGKQKVKRDRIFVSLKNSKVSRPTVYNQREHRVFMSFFFMDGLSRNPMFHLEIKILTFLQFNKNFCCTKSQTNKSYGIRMFQFHRWRFILDISSFQLSFIVIPCVFVNLFKKIHTKSLSLILKTLKALK